MSYRLIIIVTQFLALLIAGLFFWGALEARGVAACMGGSISSCVMETALLVYLSLGMIVALAFACFLFKAYKSYE